MTRIFARRKNTFRAFVDTPDHADTAALESEIDKLVYKLYGLTEEEIAIVEGRGKTTAAKGEIAAKPSRRRTTRPSSAAASPREEDDEEELA